MGQIDSQLVKAVESNDIKNTTELLDRGADANTESDKYDQKVLAIACEKGYEELAVLLVARGAVVNVGYSVVDIPLLAAASNGHEKIVDILVEKDADIHKQDYDGMTAVHVAALYNHPSVVKRLVSRAANVDIEDKKGKTPLWYAANRSHVDCVDVLLSLGANPRHKNKKNESPLDIAKKGGRATIIKKLEDAVIPSQAGQQSTSQSNDQPSPASSTLSVQSVYSEQHDQSREAASPTHSQLSFGLAAAVSETSVVSVHSTSSQLQAAAASKTTKDEDLVKQLIDEVEQSRQETETCKRRIIAVAGERRALETEMAEIRRQKEVLQRSLIGEQREKDRVVEALQHSLKEEQNEKDRVIQEKDVLQHALFDEQREKEQLQKEKEQNENRVEELEELLSAAEEANTRTREMLRESEKVLSIPSRDIQLTDKKLGGGSYGEVYIAYWNGCPVAVKMLYKTLAAYQRYIDILQQEVSISWKIHHPNIAAVCGVTVELEDEKKTAWIVMELLQGSMADVIDETRREGVRPLTLREKIDMTYGSLCGLKYLHTLPRLVLHGDIRPTNILVTALMKAKLGDLGAARFNDASNTAGMMSPDYTPPERMDGRTTRKSKETDIYSMGVSVCEMFTGLTPNPLKRMNQVQLIQQRNVRLLCNRMVAEDPNRRPSAGDGLAAIGRIRETDDYNGCPPRRMVKGKLDGVQHVTLTDQMW